MPPVGIWNAVWWIVEVMSNHTGWHSYGKNRFDPVSIVRNWAKLCKKCGVNSEKG